MPYNHGFLRGWDHQDPPPYVARVTVDVRQVVVQLLLRLHELRSSVVFVTVINLPWRKAIVGKAMGKVSILELGRWS